MKVAAAFGAALLAISSGVFAHPLDTRNIQQEFEKLDKRYSQIIPTTGVPGNTYPRLEIRQMQSQKPNQFTLFLLAMQQWQAQSESNAGSYFGVSSIHGVPLVDYNNVGQCANCAKAYGYCTHDMVLFPGWHRAYMALFEQQFMQVVNNVASQFTGSQAAIMKNAAATMRFPYWDWAAIPPNGGPVVPTAITNKYVTVNGPQGSKSILNPLFRSAINNPSAMGYADFNTYRVTYRYPSAPDASAHSQNNLMISAFAQQNSNLRQSVYQLMTACTQYLPFSNTGTPGSGGCTTSLEGIHNTVHQLAGGGQNGNILGGHMYYLPTAAFDPVFWLHHSMVDRLFAFWQTLHPNSYGASQQVSGPTWTVPAGSIQDANSPLTPFYKDNGQNFWTTNQVRNWASTFHYTYPEYVDSDGSAASISGYVNRLYGPSASATAGSSKRAVAGDSDLISAAKGVVGDATGLVNTIVTDAGKETDGLLSALTNGTIYNYYANVKAPTNGMNGSYIIFVFHGQPASENPQSWPFDKNLLGSVPMLVTPGMMMGEGLRSAGAVPLTETLNSVVTSGLLGSLAEPLVVPYLQSTLEWRVLGNDGKSTDPSSIKGLMISVSSTTSNPVSSINELPEVTDFKLLPEVTANKPAGLQHVGSWAATTINGVISSLLNPQQPAAQAPAACPASY